MTFFHFGQPRGEGFSGLSAAVSGGGALGPPAAKELTRHLQVDAIPDVILTLCHQDITMLVRFSAFPESQNAMRTTLTLDDDLARELTKLARRMGLSFKEVVNDAIRRGISTGDRPDAMSPPFVVQPQACGLRPGIDAAGLNRLVDELETEDFLRFHAQG